MLTVPNVHIYFVNNQTMDRICNTISCWTILWTIWSVVNHAPLCDSLLDCQVWTMLKMCNALPVEQCNVLIPEQLIVAVLGCWCLGSWLLLPAHCTTQVTCWSSYTTALLCCYLWAVLLPLLMQQMLLTIFKVHGPCWFCGTCTQFSMQISCDVCSSFVEP